ncbi:MAG: PorT family protein [Bacteroidota bacterium]|nr:PorT family protein [Bacteroidota bacterium]
MKKIILAISICCFSTVLTTLHAQDADTDPRGNFSFGLKAGMNYSNVYDEQGEDFRADGRVGFAGGAFFAIPVGRYLGVQPEVLISQKGFQGSGTLSGSPYSFSRTTTYIDVPLQFQFKPAQVLSIVFGPQYSFLINEKNNYTYGTNSYQQEQAFNNDNIRKNILGFVTGADIHIKHVVVSGRMGWDFQANHGDGTSSTPRYKNKWVQFTVGFRI